MAVVLYRVNEGKEESIRVPPERLQAHLQMGWQLTLEQESKEEPKDDLSSKEVRELAKEAGIEGWEKKRIQTLIDELEL